MSLQAKQDEWSELYEDPVIKDKCVNFNGEVFGTLTREDKFQLSALWLVDGIHARHIDYPKTSKELQYMKWGRSRFLRHLFNFTVIFQIIAPFFEAPYCGTIVHPYQEGLLFTDSGAPTRLALTILDFLLLIIYAVDFFLIFSINPSRKSFTKKPWSTFRLLLCVFIFCDCIAFFAWESQPRICRCVFPFLLISRRNNLKLMSQGLMISGYHSLSVIKALFSVLLLWGFVGFLLFRHADSDTVRFGNPAEGFYTSLHCFTSRPYVLRALNPLFAVNEASTVFFVTLTLAADILCINLIVAVGSRQYKLFAASVLHQRLIDRRNATSGAFYALIEDPYKERVSRDDWLVMCSLMSSKYQPNPSTAAFIFDLVVQSRGLREDRVIDLTTGRMSSRAQSLSTQYIDQEGFFRCVALLSAKLRITSTSTVGSAESTDRQSFNRPSMSSLKANLLDGNETVDSSGSAAGSKIEVTMDQTDRIKSHGISGVTTTPVGDANVVTVSVVPIAAAGPTDSSDAKGNNRAVFFSVDNETTADKAATTRSSLASHRPTTFAQNEYLSKLWTDIRGLCVLVSSLQITVDLGNIWKSNNTDDDSDTKNEKKINVLDSVYLFLHIMLIIQLAMISSKHRDVHWFYFGWFLEVFFVWYQMVKMISSGLSTYFTFSDHIIDVVINFSVFIVLLVLGSDYTSNGYNFSMNTTMCCYLVIQSLRLFKLFFVVNDIELFEHILPVLLRASFIFFSVVYFFSIFGYSYFCSSLDYSDVENASDDNDATQWLQYPNLLNFSSNLHSLFTMFEVAILGNWSMVMDAAALSSDPASSYIFFYTFRLLITLCVLPILLSFILQAFLSALNRKANSNNTNDDQKKGKVDPSDRASRSHNASAGIPGMDHNYSSGHKNAALLSEIIAEESDSGGDSAKSPIHSNSANNSGRHGSSRVSFSLGGGSGSQQEVTEEYVLMTDGPINSPSAKPKKTMPKIQFGVDKTNIDRSKNTAKESVANVSGGSGKGKNQEGGSVSGRSNNAGSSGRPSDVVTVQYDSNATSMMTLWAQNDLGGNTGGGGGRSPPGTGATSGKRSSLKGGTVMNDESGSTAGVAASVAGQPEKDILIAELQKKLADALNELQIEKDKSKSL